MDTAYLPQSGVCRLNVPLAALLATLVVTVPAPAEKPDGARSFRAEYSISLYGLPLARSSFTSTFHEGRFTVEGSLASAGVARLIDSTYGTVVSHGRFSGSTPQPTRYASDYQSGKKKQRTEISFSSGNVAKTVNVPPLKKRGNDFVPVGKSDLRAVADPLAATLIRADSIDDVCGRTVKVFDGEMRANLTFSGGKRGTTAIRGYEGQTVTCSASFEPVSGYRKKQKTIAYLRNKGDITVTFAPLGSTGVYAPIHATVGTQIGTITIAANRLEAAD